MKKIEKILMANRGEISLRVLSTCRELGIKMVSVFSEDDKELPHALQADESYSLGSGSLAETYLNQDKIIEIAKKSNVDAIHPGYGFLSENTSFCQRVYSEGLIFIGPSVEAIELMGDKKTSKQKMEEAGIPLIPGYHGENQDEGFLKDQASKIGFPLLIKATAGGGGKGMRIVESEKEFSESLASAKREALNAFGNDQVLLERYITSPRHIEVQVMSDTHGNHLHYYERECSIQRRYQKIVEETPSPALSDKTRKNICETAVKIAKSINYVGAGTVEFIYDVDDSFYFLEMNTRLQVEHPISEMITGVDLVKKQIEVASGQALNIKQEDIIPRGHSIETRIYAEDPDNNFLPTIGKIEFIGESFLNHVRLDCGFMEGNSVTVNYDPMLAKLIVWAENRELAIEKMNLALDDFSFMGLKTNRDYLKRVISHSEFKKGNTFTYFVEKNKESLAPTPLSQEEVALAVASNLLLKAKHSSNVVGTENHLNNDPWEALNNFRSC